jgi:malonyl CoA-acyl carrier protein transacylase
VRTSGASRAGQLEKTMTTAFIFPGQGAQHVGMAKTIVENHSVAKELF